MCQWYAPLNESENVLQIVSIIKLIRLVLSHGSNCCSYWLKESNPIKFGMHLSHFCMADARPTISHHVYSQHNALQRIESAAFPVTCGCVYCIENKEISHFLCRFLLNLSQGCVFYNKKRIYLWYACVCGARPRACLYIWCVKTMFNIYLQLPCHGTSWNVVNKHCEGKCPPQENKLFGEYYKYTILAHTQIGKISSTCRITYCIFSGCKLKIALDSYVVW